MKSKSKITVRYAETDQMGIVHHANYPIWYEVARTDLIEQIGTTYTKMERSGLLLPLIELHSRYIGAAYYEDKLIIEAALKAVTRVKLEFGYTIYREGDTKPINTGRTIHGTVNKDLHPVNMQRQFPELYQKLQDAVETD